MYGQTLKLAAALADHGWRKTGRTEGIEGYTVNRWRRGRVTVTLAWTGDHEVATALVQISGEPLRRIGLAGAYWLLISDPSADQGLFLKRHRGFIYSVRWAEPAREAVAA